MQKQLRKEMPEYFPIEKFNFIINILFHGKCLRIKGNFTIQNLETFLVDKIKFYIFNYKIFNFLFKKLKIKK